MIKFKRDSDILSDVNNPEENVNTFDNFVTQGHVTEFLNDDLQSYTEDALQQLSNDIFDEMILGNPDFRHYNRPVYPECVTITAQNSNKIFRGPEDENSAIVAVSFVEGWRKTWGGEIIWYAQGEPSLVLEQHPGRVYVSYGPTPFKISAPSESAEHDLVVVLFRITKR